MAIIDFKPALLFIASIFLLNSALSQKTVIQSITLKVDAPIPFSGTTFRTFWCPTVDADISGTKLLKNNFFAGITVNYSLFHCRWIHQLKSSIHIVNPNICFGYNLFNLKKFQVQPEFSLGYSWLFLTNPETPSAYLKKYNESGVSIKPVISLSYTFKKKFSLGLTGSYKIIFTKYGIRDVELYEGKEEADYITYANAGLYLRKNF
jgi:hypothetical protein